MPPSARRRRLRSLTSALRTPGGCECAAQAQQPHPSPWAPADLWGQLASPAVLTEEQRQFMWVHGYLHVPPGLISDGWLQRLREARPTASSSPHPHPHPHP